MSDTGIKYSISRDFLFNSVAEKEKEKVTEEKKEDKTSKSWVSSVFVAGLKLLCLFFSTLLLFVFLWFFNRKWKQKRVRMG